MMYICTLMYHVRVLKKIEDDDDDGDKVRIGTSFQWEHGRTQAGCRMNIGL